MEDKINLHEVYEILNQVTRNFARSSWVPGVRWLNFPSSGTTVDFKMSLPEKEAAKN